MQVKISVPEAYSLMSESDFKVMDDRTKEIESLGLDLTNWDRVFYFDDSANELFLEFLDSDQIVRYRLMFKLKRSVGRPATGTTKKVSLTLPDEVWELIGTKKDEWGVSQSQALRMMLEGYLYSLKNRSDSH